MSALLPRLRSRWNSNLVFRFAVIMYGVVFLPLSVLVILSFSQSRALLSAQTEEVVRNRAQLIANTLEWELQTIQRLAGLTAQNAGVIAAVQEWVAFEATGMPIAAATASPTPGEYRAYVTARLEDAAGRIRSNFLLRPGTSVHILFGSSSLLSAYEAGDPRAGTQQAYRPHVPQVLRDSIATTPLGFSTIEVQQTSFLLYRIPFQAVPLHQGPAHLLVLTEIDSLRNFLSSDGDAATTVYLAGGRRLLSIGADGLPEARATFRVSPPGGTFRLDYHVPMIETLDQFETIQRRISYLLTAGVFLAGVLSVAGLRSAVRPIRSIVVALRSYPGMPSAGFARGDDVGTISGSISSLQNRVGQLVQQIVDAERERLHLYFASIRAQVTPHFLFNTLNSIRWKLAAEGESEAAHALTRLGYLLERSTTRLPEMIPLSEELDIVEAFLDIERFRFRAAILFERRMEPALQSFLVPRFALQPLVENAVKNRRPTGDSLRITATAHRVDGRIEIVIRDNGRGLPTIPTTGQSPAITGLGLETVRARLQHEYPAGAEIELRPHADGAETRIVIHGV